MRSITIAVCAAGLLALSGAAQAAEPTTHDLGGPMRSGKMCWVGTDGINGVYGYWKRCEPVKKMKRAAKAAKKKAS